MTYWESAMYCKTSNAMNYRDQLQLFMVPVGLQCLNVLYGQTESALSLLEKSVGFWKM